MSLRTVSVALAILVATPVVAVPAHAAKSDDAKQDKEIPSIEMTGIEAFDSIFRQVKGIHDTLDSAQGRIDGAIGRIAVAAGQPEGTSLAMSMWHIKQTAGGPIDVKLEGTKPVLTLGGAGGAEAKGMVNAVNLAVIDVAQVPADLAQLPQQVMQLVAACKEFPAQLNPKLLADAGLKPLELPKIAKTLGRNVKATAATPKRIEGVVASAKGLLTGIPQGLKATEAPTEEYLAEAKAARKGAKAAAAGGLDAITVAPSRVQGLVGQAMASFHDAEVQAAIQQLGQVDAQLAAIAEPVPASDLESLYQSQALVHLVSGNAAAASAAVAQALVVDPDAKPIADLGPEYARLHKMLSKADVLREVEVPVQGSANALVSGQPIDAGAGTVTLTAGRHLLQVERNGVWTSQFVWVQDGFALTL